MTTASRSSRLGTSAPDGVSLDALSAPLALAFTAALFALCHPYGGIVGDANLYIGRILADLDPADAGRDMTFVLDGQSRFTLFPLFARPLVAAFGASLAAALIAGAGAAAFFATLVWLARQLSAGDARLAWAIVVAVSVLPATYSNAGVFAFAEANAVPRPFAEAAVMASLAAMLAARPLVAAGLLLVAAALHPIMALPGFGVAALLLARHRPRAALGLTIAALMAGLVLALARPTRLGAALATMDPDWLGMVIARSPHLFPTLWDATTFARLLAQGTTILLAACLAPPPTRRLLVAVLVTGALGLGAAVLCSDTLHLVLAVQAQFWRATWLVGVVAGAALMLCVSALWREGPGSRLVLAPLLLAWFVDPGLPGGAVLAALTLLLFARRAALQGAVTARTADIAIAVVVLVALAWRALPVLGYVRFLQAAPADVHVTMVDAVRNEIPALPLVLGASAWLLWWPTTVRPGRRTALLAFATLVATVAATLSWNERPAAGAMTEYRQDPPGFAAMMAGRPAAVLWIDGAAEAWTMLDRPQYMTGQQAVGIVFSRPLAMAWRSHVEALAAVGLARRNVLEPFRRVEGDDRPRIDPAAVAAFCRRADAPGAIILPAYADRPHPALPGATLWPTPPSTLMIERSTLDWHRVLGYLVAPCAPRHA